MMRGRGNQKTTLEMMALFEIALVSRRENVEGVRALRDQSVRPDLSVAWLRWYKILEMMRSLPKTVFTHLHSSGFIQRN